MAFSMNAQTANTDVLPDAALKKLREVGLSIEHIEPSPVKDIYTVISREGVSYVSKDGDYIFTGSLFHVNGKDVENTTEQAILKGVREFATKTKSIEYKSANENTVWQCLRILHAAFARNCIKIFNPISTPGSQSNSSPFHVQVSTPLSRGIWQNMVCGKT